MEVNLRLLYRNPTAGRTVEQFRDYGLRLRSAIANHVEIQRFRIDDGMHFEGSGLITAQTA